MPEVIPSRAETDFAITINFKPGEPDPTRIFRTAIGLINEFTSFDKELARGVDARLVPTLLLESVEEGSLKIWLSTALRAIDDDALKSGDWKKLVGNFLFQAKYKLLKYLEKEGDQVASDASGIELLRSELQEEAKLLDLGTIPTPVIPPRSFFIIQIVQISAAVATLRSGEYVEVQGRRGGSVRISSKLELTSDDVERLSVASSPVYDSEVTIKVKRPDFIGDSRWEFILGNHAIEAKMLDLEWMNEFRKQRVPLLPGASLRVTLRQSISMGFDQEQLGIRYFVLQVHGVVDPTDTRNLQLTLPN
jgi:hypothetical protein